MNSWYGWIPNLTGNIYLECDPTRLGARRLNLDEAKKLLKDLGIKYKSGFDYFIFYRNISDDPNEPELPIVLGIDDKVLKQIIIIDKDSKTLIAESSINIEPKGRIEIVVKESEEKLVKQLYIIARDLYHSHLFHHGSEDLLLKPVKCDKTEAIERVLEQYFRKIITYHRLLKRTISGTIDSLSEEEYRKIVNLLRNTLISVSNLLKTAKGEMLHGLSLCEIYSNELDEEKTELVKSRFSTAIASFDVLSEELEKLFIVNVWSYISELNETTGKLTKLIAVLTFVMMILVILQLFR